jgi:hypothetical protein
MSVSKKKRRDRSGLSLEARSEAPRPLPVSLTTRRTIPLLSSTPLPSALANDHPGLGAARSRPI